jgi:hypothetical protein
MTEATGRGVRFLLARLLAALGAVFFALPFFGVVDLLVVLVNDPDWRTSYLLEAGWGVLFTVLVAAPFAGLAFRPERGLLVAQLVAVSVALAAATLWSAYAPALVPAVLVVVLATGVGQLAGIRPRAVPLDRWLRWIVVLGAVGGGAFATRVVGEYPAAEPDITWGIDHHPVQAAVGLALVAVAAVAAAGVGGRVAGWRVPVWTVALGAGWLGAWSIGYPDVPGSAGRDLGTAALAWAVLFAVTAEVRVRCTAGGPG